MTVNEIWINFHEKLQNDSFIESDFHVDMRSFLLSFLSGDKAKFRRDKFINSPFNTYDCEVKKCVLLKCTDGEYRFDF
jgi:hypothetical protein